MDSPIEIAKSLIITEEGLRLKLYKDTEGVLTIGYGRNIQQNGIRICEAEYLLDNDLDDAASMLSRVEGYFNILDPVRQSVLIDLCFAMGLSRFLGFRRMRAALGNGDFEEAAKQLVNSKWAVQTKMKRAEKLADILKNGRFDHE